MRCDGHYDRNESIPFLSKGIESLHLYSLHVYGVPIKRCFYHSKLGLKMKETPNVNGRTSMKYIENKGPIPRGDEI